jgi:rhamnose utilization protein RhaD (predicted bifunctional aldolase and dehydrogenase)/NAD(P)-dependent dehydrogenase (short-subunit alcohol dehydrogenase family)
MADVAGELLARSNRLGSDPRNTNYAGGNASAKGAATDPVTGRPAELLWVKGSGGDLGTLRAEGLAVLRLDRLRALVDVYPGVDREDEMVAAFDYCAFGKGGAAPSIDTAMHGLVEAAHVDHLHPDAGIAFATAAGGEALTAECFGDRVAWVPWRRPGFQLGLDIAAIRRERPEAIGVILGSHGITAWGDTSDECESRSLEIISAARKFIDERGTARPFGETVHEPLPERVRRARAAHLAPVIRGLASTDGPRLGHFTDSPAVLEFLSGSKLTALAALGTSCPDHFLRTKVRPMVADLPPSAPLEAVAERLRELHAAYREDYKVYYERYADAASPPMRGAEAISSYAPIPESEKFRIEYWELEEAKLRRRPAPKPLAGRVALVTGGGSGIGRATAVRLAAEGACVVVADKDGYSAGVAASDIGSADVAVPVAADVRRETDVAAAFASAALAFGGVDLVVNNAGLSISKPLTETSADDWDLLHDVLARGSFLVSREAAKVMTAQGTGGDIVYICSKNAVFAGPSNVAYGAAKADQAHQVRLLAAELGPAGIRVNGINPDAVVRGSGIFASGWGAQRAAVYGVPESGLGAFYASRTLLKREVLPEHVAAAVFALCGGDLPLTTGLLIPVDAGVAAAFLR